MIRYALQRRWIGWHLLWAAAFLVCLRLAMWQWDVAGRPHPAGAPVQEWRNYAYAVNWVIFAGVAVWFWWRFLRDQRNEERATPESPPEVPPPPAAGVFDPFAERDVPRGGGSSPERDG